MASDKKRVEFPSSAKKSWLQGKALKDSGQSTPYLVTHKSNHAEGVLKVAYLNPAQRARLTREISLLANLTHPAIAELLDSDSTSETPWLITARGEPFDQWWKTRRKYLDAAGTADAARAVCMHLLSGLTVCHQADVIHRDIKPKNVIMIGTPPRAALIDFGIAFVKDEERLTELDDRAVGNKFAAPPAAYYGQIENPLPWWDCLGIGWLWGWMLSEGKLPDDYRYHWKYHRMIEHPDAEAVRALTAVCSDEATAPEDAAKMLTLARNLGLITMNDKDEATPTGFEEAAAVAQKRLREDKLYEQERRERIQAAVAALAVIYEGIRQQMLAVAEAAAAGGLPVNYDHALNQQPIQAALQPLVENTSEAVKLFLAEGDIGVGGPLTIWLSCRYKPILDDCWPLHLLLQISPGPKYPDNDIIHRRDGTPLVNWAQRTVDNNYLPKLLESWLKEPNHWVRDVW